MSVEHTFEYDVTNAQELEKNLLDLAYECARRVRQDGLEARGISVKVKDVDFSTRTKSLSLTTPATSGAVFFNHARPLLDELLAARWHPVRLLGVRADKVAEPTEHIPTIQQESLFDLEAADVETEPRQAWDSTDRILDDVAKKFPEAAIKPASLLRHERSQRMSAG